MASQSSSRPGQVGWQAIGNDVWRSRDPAKLAVWLAELIVIEQHVWSAGRAELAQKLGITPADRSFVTAIAGSVAAGKSRLADELADALATAGLGPAVVVRGDSFLLPNEVLERRGHLDRKGFPESFDAESLDRFRCAVLSGRPEITTPVYSHEAYDILPGQTRRLAKPAILIFEGVHALHTPPGAPRLHDFGVYIEAAEADLARWYVERFLALKRHEAAALARRAAEYGAQGKAPEALALDIWNETNLPNLRQHIAPSRWVADLVVEKSGAHEVSAIRLRV